jgi:hypothetical protein
MIRLVVRTLGADNYAAFALLCALGGWFLLADFGLGFSLQNFISKSRAHGVEYGQLLKSAVKITFILFVFEITCLALLSPWTGSQLLRQFSFIGRLDKYILFFSACSLQLRTKRVLVEHLASLQPGLRARCCYCHVAFPWPVGRCDFIVLDSTGTDWNVQPWLSLDGT